MGATQPRRRCPDCEQNIKIEIELSTGVQVDRRHSYQLYASITGEKKRRPSRVDLYLLRPTWVVKTRVIGANDWQLIGGCNDCE